MPTLRYLKDIEASEKAKGSGAPETQVSQTLKLLLPLLMPLWNPLPALRFGGICPMAVRHMFVPSPSPQMRVYSISKQKTDLSSLIGCRPTYWSWAVILLYQWVLSANVTLSLSLSSSSLLRLWNWQIFNAFHFFPQINHAYTSTHSVAVLPKLPDLLFREYNPITITAKLRERTAGIDGDPRPSTSRCDAQRVTTSNCSSTAYMRFILSQQHLSLIYKALLPKGPSDLTDPRLYEPGSDWDERHLKTKAMAGVSWVLQYVGKGDANTCNIEKEVETSSLQRWPSRKWKSAVTISIVVFRSPQVLEKRGTRDWTLADYLVR